MEIAESHRPLSWSLLISPRWRVKLYYWNLAVNILSDTGFQGITSRLVDTVGINPTSDSRLIPASFPEYIIRVRSKKGVLPESYRPESVHL